MPNFSVVLKARNVRWRTVVQVGLLVALASHLLLLAMLAIYLALFWTIRAAGLNPTLLTDGVQLSGGVSALFELSAYFFSQVAIWGLPALTMLVTASAAARVAHSVESSARLYGALVGLIAAATGLAVNMAADLQYGGGQTLYSGTLFVLTVVAGWSGGVPVHLEKVKAEAVYRASRALHNANSLQAIARAIGENMASAEVSGVALWQASVAADSMELSLMADWVRKGSSEWPVTMSLEGATREAAHQLLYEQRRPLLLYGRALPRAEGQSWKELGIDALLFLPLNEALDAQREDAAEELLIIIGAESAQAFSEERLRQYMLLDAQVSLMLENLRLVEQARQAGVFAERQRLAHEIHDTLAQGFTSIVMHSEAAEQIIGVDTERLQHHIAMIRQTARENLSQARRLVWALRPKALERASLSQAIHRAVRRWSEANAVEASAVVTGDVYPLHPTVEIVALRAVQEALNNISKHANAQHVIVTVSFTKDALLLDVQDDGVGFDPGRIFVEEREPESGGYGLAALAERLQQVGGSLTVESEPGHGATVAAVVPTSKTNKPDSACVSYGPPQLARSYANGHGEYVYESN